MIFIHYYFASLFDTDIEANGEYCQRPTRIPNGIGIGIGIIIRRPSFCS
jgi:hypothetical protein